MTDIALIGPQGAGKTTLALNLVEHRRYVRIGIADAVKAIALDCYPGIQKGTLHNTWRDGKIWIAQGRELMQDIGAALREVDQDFWMKLWQNKYEGAKLMGRSVVCDDLRLVHEIDFIRKLGTGMKIVKLEANKSKRALRVQGGLIRSHDVTEQEWKNASYDLSLDTTDSDAQETFRALHEWMTGGDEL